MKKNEKKSNVIEFTETFRTLSITENLLYCIKNDFISVFEECIYDVVTLNGMSVNEMISIELEEGEVDYNNSWAFDDVVYNKWFDLEDDNSSAMTAVSKKIKSVSVYRGDLSDSKCVALWVENEEGCLSAVPRGFDLFDLNVLAAVYRLVEFKVCKRVGKDKFISPNVGLMVDACKRKAIELLVKSVNLSIVCGEGAVDMLSIQTKPNPKAKQFEKK